MTKRITLFFVFFFTLSILYGQETGDPVSRLDSAVKTLALEIRGKIPAGGNPKVALGQWVYHEMIPDMGLYWAAQLAGELANVPGRSFVLLAGGPGDSDWTLAGEIIVIPGKIRVYTRLVRSAGQSIEAGFQTDLDMNGDFAEMLSGGDGGSASVIRDAHEFDSMENPLTVELASAEGGPLINRTLHSGTDEDFFLLLPDRAGALSMETTGDIDTYLELYNADSGERITSNDDGGSGLNARLRHQTDSGARYIAKVRGYDGNTGSYGFRAWLAETVHLPPDEYESDDTMDSARDISIGVAQQHTFTAKDDVDWVTFQADRPGSYVIRTRGVNSARLDTYIELYDGNSNSIDSDDDGGESYDSLLSVRLQAGTYYLKVECLNDEPDQPYSVSVDAE